MDFADPVDHRMNKKESEKGDKCLDLAKELKKTSENKSDNDTKATIQLRDTNGIMDERKQQTCNKYVILRETLQKEGIEKE